MMGCHTLNLSHKIKNQIIVFQKQIKKSLFLRYAIQTNSLIPNVHFLKVARWIEFVMQFVLNHA